ncbi:urease accessory protein [Natronocella acetinitrilica]|uniref:Urease accessory protein UreD n=1 Tax=Natronocella acetinitrilica TaxID=414046 RepID=A0AAE3G6X1_9GAMM|nr:urease accessory protein UreD [Natronocella acetinitrilica]MCP1676779.1 urease accessory protein [Natronocella acetinitrilica]
MAAAVPDVVEAGGWLARLRLKYARRRDRTVLAHRYHEGPLLVQRSFHPEGEPCHSYVIHPPGGVVGGDRLLLDVDVAAGAHAVLTTPAAAKFYRSGGHRAEQDQHFTVADGGALEFLPAETILHGGCDVNLRNRFDLVGEARLCAWDVVCLGRPGSGDHYASGACLQDLRVFRDGVICLHERLRLDAGDRLLTAPWGLGGRTVIGTLVATPAPPGLEQQLRENLDGADTLRLGVTRLDDLLVLRCLGPGAEPVRALLERAWTLLREPVLGRPACPPRIWRT